MSFKFLTFLSPAKLNLGLKIVGKRADGYHLLNTVFCLIDLFDVIQIQLTTNGKISLIEHEQAWSYHKDLAYRAAKLLKDVTNTNFGANIKVKKTIPSGSGLGGGSSNAATVLIALNTLWQTKLSNQELLVLGTRLGADVPFFIYGKNAFASGVGERLTAIEIPNQYFVVICPNFHIATKDVFAKINYQPQNNRKEEFDAKYLINSYDNDLIESASIIEPQLKNIIEELKRFGKPAMTGSGSAIFLSFTDLDNAKKVALSLDNSYNTYLVKSLSFSPVYTTDF